MAQVGSFPELRYYLIRSRDAQTAKADRSLAGRTDVTSGASASDEYKRTVGALFALYWLARIGIDGEEQGHTWCTPTPCTFPSVHC